MSRITQIFRQSDVVRAIKAARAAGEEVARVEIDREGKIVVVLGKQEAPPMAPEDPFTQWERQHEQAKATRRRERI